MSPKNINWLISSESEKDYSSDDETESDIQRGT